MESSYGRTNTYYSRPSGNHDAYEISIVGLPGSGKTTLIEGYCGEPVNKEMPYTLKQLSKNYNIQNLYLSEQNGNENLKNFNADAIILTVDLTNKESYFYAMIIIGNYFKDKHDFNNYPERFSPDTKLIIALTKSDAETELKVTEDDIYKLIDVIESKNIQYVNALETSIVDNKSIEKLFSFLINKLEKFEHKKKEAQSSTFFHTQNKILHDENHSMIYVLHMKNLIMDPDTTFSIPNYGFLLSNSLWNLGGKKIAMENGETKLVTDTIYDVWTKIQSAENSEISFIQAEEEIRNLFEKTNDDNVFNKKFYEAALDTSCEGLMDQNATAISKACKSQGVNFSG